MGLFEKLGLAGQGRVNIDWELTPADTFGMFESWGGKERVRSGRERFYYFYIDNWGEAPRLCFMERGIKFARVLAEIEAPPEMLARCIAKQGKGSLDKTYAIDEALRQWLLAKVIETEDDAMVIPLVSGLEAEPGETGLPQKGSPRPPLEPHPVRHEPGVLSEEEVGAVIRAHQFFDSQHNPAGRFVAYLEDNGDGLTVSELVTGVMWQRAGCDITNIRHVHSYVKDLNRQFFAGHADWRLPTLEEALALLQPEANPQGLHLHPCFSAAQPFIFLADERRPGGYWFIDFKQATVFWASGTIPGGFGRACRTL